MTWILIDWVIRNIDNINIEKLLQITAKNGDLTVLGIAGMKGDTLILALPGSTRGASETMDALFPFILHIYGIIEMARHN